MKLYPFQQEILKQTKTFNRVAYYLDMGLGKTFVGSQKMKQLGARVNLIVCQKSKVSDWVAHIQTYYPEYAVFDATSRKKEDKRSLKYGFWVNYRAGSVVPSVLVINYELLWRRDEFSDLSGFTLLLDESSMIQNEAAKRSKFILRMTPENVILLSGTPTAGKYERLWSQCHLLGWNISKRAYWNTFIMTRQLPGVPVPLVAGYKNVPRLKEKLREHGAVFKKTEEVIDLPEQNDVIVTVKSSGDYRKFEKNQYVVADGTELIGGTSLTQRIYLRELCGIYSKEKLQALADLLDSTEDRLIVFYNFEAELTRMRAITTRPVSVINGSEKDLSAYEKSDNSVTFVQYQAGAMGLNLQKANKTIYYTLPERSELFEQSRKRTHRIGQTRPCFYYFLMCEDSIEQKVKKALDMRKDFTDELFRRWC